MSEVQQSPPGPALQISVSLWQLYQIYDRSTHSVATLRENQWPLQITNVVTITLSCYNCALPVYNTLEPTCALTRVY